MELISSQCLEALLIVLSLKMLSSNTIAINQTAPFEKKLLHPVLCLAGSIALNPHH